ncbi:MAG: transposase [Coprobacillaceae bacterium]
MSRIYYYKVISCVDVRSDFQIASDELDIVVKRVYESTHNIYGSRKVNADINKYYPGVSSSRFKVNESMKRQGIQSKYCKKRKTPYPNKKKNFDYNVVFENKLDKNFRVI